MAEQKKDEEEIKVCNINNQTYKMIEGDYSVQIRVLEANDLIPTISGIAGIGFLSSKGTACNAFVEITVLGQTKRTKVVKNQLSPIFNQIVSFKLNDMKKAQLQNATILITVYDRKNAILGNKIIGSYELDLSSVYFSLHHELYRTYLALSDPTDEREGTMGYVLCNITVLGPNDEPFVHDVTTEKKADATKGATLIPKKIQQWPHLIRINLLKGEHMVPLDMTSPEIDAYVVVKYGGNKIRSKTITSRNPEWYQQLNLACMLPNQSKFVDISVYDSDLVGDDDLVGTFQIPFKDIPEPESQPIWANLYGAPLQGESKKADMMNLFGTTMGSHYRGRICYTICRFDQRDAKTYKEDLQFHFPENPMPVSEQKSYILRVDLLEGHAFPIRKQALIQIKMGPYLMVSKPAVDVEGALIFNENLPDKKVLFPKNVDEIPDVMIYMADDNIEDRRHSFIRVKAKDILDRELKAQVYKLTEDRSLDLIADDEFPGFLYANVQLMSKMPGQRQIYQPNLKPKVEYELRVYLYLGRNLPPADATGTSDPLVKIRCAGQIVQSKACTQTLNPGWYETLKMNVKLLPLDDKTTVVPAGMFVMVFDQDLDENNNASYDLIGRVWITLEPQALQFQTEFEVVNMYYKKPKWYNIIYDATDEVQGQILLAYSLIPKDKADLIPNEEIYPKCVKQELSLFCIGLRNIEEMVGQVEPSNLAVSFDISGDAYDPIFTDYKKVKANGVNINRLITLNVDVPRNQNFCPVIDCYVWNQNLPEEPKLLGVRTIDLAKILNEYYRTIKLKPGEILPENDNDESDIEEAELMKTLFDEKNKKQTRLEQIKEADINEEDELINLDKLKLNIPQELPQKKRVVQEYEYEDVIKQYEEEMQRYKEEEEELIQQSKIGDSNVQDLLNLQEEAPVYKPTTFGGGFQMGQQADLAQSEVIIEQFPREENIPQEQTPIKVTKPMDADVEQEGAVGMVQQLEPQINSDQQLQPQQTAIQLIVFTESQPAVSPNQPSLSMQIHQRQQSQQPDNQKKQNISDEQKPESLPPNQSQSIRQQQSFVKQQQSQQEQSQSRKQSIQQQVLNEQYQQPESLSRKSQSIKQSPLLKKQQSQLDKSQSQLQQQVLNEQQDQLQKQVMISQLQSQIPQSQSRRESQQQQQSNKNSQPRLESPQFQNIDNEIPERKDSKSQFSQKLSQQPPRDSQSQMFNQQRRDSQSQQKPPSIPISPIQKGNPSNDSQQQLDDYNLNNEDSRIIPLEPKSKVVAEQQFKMARQIPPPMKGSQRSIRKLSQVDQRVVFEMDQHIKNDGSKIKSQIIELNAGDVPLSQQLQQLPQVIKTIQVPTDLSFSKASKVSSKALTVTGQKDNMDAVKKPKTKKKKLQKSSRKAVLFGFTALLPKKKKTVDIETYEDYDTDDNENLDVTPVWLKERKFLPDDLEDKVKISKKFLKYTIMSGQSRGKDSQFLSEKSEPQRVCDFKCIFLEAKQGQDIQKKKDMYVQMMRPKQFVCRLYFLQGIDIQSGGEEPPDLYIKVRTAVAEHELKKGSLRQGTNSPQFYFPFELPMEVPGSAIIEVEIWSQLQMGDELIGKTLIDLEDRYFSVSWHKFERKPIENRNVMDEFGSSIGRLQMWIDLVEKSQAKINPMIKITAPPRYPFELRTIIYETRNCVFKDELEKCNDLYCRAGIANQELQETDTHWRCRAKGSFNWRIKNKVNYPPLPDEFGTNKFKIQLWDKDIVGSDELIGETTFDLNTHKMIDKAVKRLEPVQITQRIREKGGIITDKFWLDVYHPDAVDEEGQKISQGQVLVSFELLPLTEAEKKPNGFGRDPPNVFPPLGEPTGRLSFDITNPLGFIKDIMGPDLYNKICKFFLMAALMTVGVTVGWIFLGPLIANVITK